jgi:hypothetical protein
VRPIILLSTLLVKLNLEWFQGLRRPSDIKLWTADHAQMDVGKVQSNKFFKELQDLFKGPRTPRPPHQEAKGEKVFQLPSTSR